MKSKLPFAAVAIVLASVGVLAVAQTRVAAPAKPTVAAPAPAPAQSEEVFIRNAVAKAIPGVTIDSVRPSVIPGYREVAIGSRVVYVSADGKYLMQGSLIQLDTRSNLTNASEAVLRRNMLAAVGKERRIIFAPPNPKYRVTVFTDIDCGYCRKLHSQMADYNKEGIAVEYLFFPRAGIGSESYDKAVNVWCAADRRKAMTDAKLDRPVASKQCANPISDDYRLARRVGVDGTPAVYAADGSQVGGYLSPEEMLASLERLTVQAKPAVAAAAPAK
ncbi:DsbC family protein [Arenimonas oryziterrae]|uniref:Thiol:disulfide interchange protein n=1 Tax=Arenimonas oryziterrae DSM 21050 = YC6267 TaxID=1121015 RepID=A0A091BFN2_9GAMM|nr:DsbC family protein [Arenimonas oryziterrae]KFN43195.1 hypothetical protein N789_11575 [Arenimonas oryziterrae DSM 21050 = YC6267]